MASPDFFEDARFDGLFTTVAQQAGGIDALFDYFFGFLLRKTDYFTVDAERCRNMVDESFAKWSRKAEEIKVAQARKAQAAQKDLENRPKFEEVGDDEPAVSTPQAVPTPPAVSTPKVPSRPVANPPTGSDEDDSAKPPPPPGNGGQTDKYRWTQTLENVDIYIPVPDNTVSKNCTIKILPTKLYVGLKGCEPIIDGELSMRIKTEDSMWTLVDKKMIHICVEKSDNMRWWSCVIKGDEEIDTKAIVPESSKLSDLDQEMRSTVEKMMFDQRQKEAGLPTSEQMKQAELLEKFKNSHPELDFSNAKINWGNTPFGA